MKKISFWASTHRELSWIIITLCHVYIYFSAMFVGSMLNNIDFILPKSFLLTALLFLFLFLLFYLGNTIPYKKYVLQKICDFGIGLSVFVCLCFVYNNNTLVSSLNTYSSLHGSLVISRDHNKKDKTKTSVLSRSKKITKQQSEKLKRLLSNKGQDENENVALKIFWVILVTTGVIAGLLLVAALACSLSCSGADAAAFLVGIVGFVGILILGFLAIRKIWKKKSHSEKEKQ